jgi:hypothetical protein
MSLISKFDLSFPWCEAGGGEGSVDIEIEARHPREHYRRHYGAFEGEHIDCQPQERHAWIYAHCARSLVAFMDATGLERSYAFSKALVEGSALPAGHDHTKLWRVPEAGSPLGWSSGQFLLTTEPYGQIHAEVEAWCQERRWPCCTMPPRLGLWWPTDEEGTRLILISPPEVGVDLAPLVPLLHERLPVWMEPKKGDTK